MSTKIADKLSPGFISMQPPRYWQLLKLLFPDYNPGIHAVTFGNTVYVPFELPDPELLMVHERVHLVQQRYSRIWGLIFLFKYRFNTNFRIKSELEAFTVQYKYFVTTTSVKKLWYEYRDQIATELSGSLYGFAITKEAVKRHLDNVIK
jgi:hypothetical protein